MRHAAAHSIVPLSVPHSRSHEGRFGRLFGRGFSVWEPPGAGDLEKQVAIHEFAVTEMFAEDTPPDSAMPVGYTYLGQFVDHDITFDPQSSLTKHNDPDGLQNFRSPRLDLDSLYGRGPDDQPYLYDQQRVLHDGFAGFLRIGRGQATSFVEPDLQRNADGVAIIGDPRNDENVIVSQLQLAFAQLHNRILQQLADAATGPATAGRKLFLEAQRITVWFYQYVVWNDFVSRITEGSIFAKALTIDDDGGDGTGPRYSVTWGLDDVYDWSENPFMPVEFSVAAYRFGHSMIRGGYQINFPVQNGVGHEFGKPIFAAPPVPAAHAVTAGPADLRGGRALPEKHTLQWDWYFDFVSSRKGPPTPFPQLAHKIDTHLSRSVFAIPAGPGVTNPLAELNIKRGWRMELPPATEVATALHIEPMPIEHPMEESLWVYILKEAQVQQDGERLGAVGSTLVAAVFSGLLRGDPFSYLNRAPHWTPGSELVDGQPMFEKVSDVRDADRGVELRPQWEVVDLLHAAGVPEDVPALNGIFRA
ncbi:peroxidase [Agromyces sp. CFH 90414]|uniref:Peroxidase n=1 Tax=Agromyces agglutinans TaxID=2662258 RepID=A0A6I2F6U9_9MICO|nr:peroxidase family protein [Agromyces agglutinans]MRG61205.1 peroxidase [Agromyces agglutinans]